MLLAEKQKKQLRGLAHSLKPVVMLGGEGVTAGVLGELDQALSHHELLKVKVRVGDRRARNEAIDQLCERCKATLVQRIGNVAVLYRPNPEKPRIKLVGG